MNRIVTEQTNPAADTATSFWNTKVYNSHGKGNLDKESDDQFWDFFMIRITYPTVTSKMFDPTEDETAISPKPLRATITLVNRSGIDVPAAKKVRPITCKLDKSNKSV